MRFPRVAVTDAGEALLAGGNLVFRVDGKNALDDPAIRSAWEKACEKPSEGAAVMTCLVSGKQAPIARLHPAIKGVVGAQAMGASLVGFNARAFESYGHDEEQGLNAPVSEYATFAYSTALNYLLSDRKHHMRIGDTTVVYWADKHDQACVDIMSDFLNPQTGGGDDKDNESGKGDPDRVIDAVMQRLAQGLPIGEVDPDANFYVLGLAPNAARLSVRFFQRDTFGAMLDNLYQHYERLDIARAPYEKKYLVPYRLLVETENPNAKQPAATSLLGGALLRSILGNQRYPEALFEQTILRVRATQDNEERRTRKVTRGRAAIIKAYLIKTATEARRRSPWGPERRAFRRSLRAGKVGSRCSRAFKKPQAPGLNSTIKNKYYDSASATPSVIFPIVIGLCDKHLTKLSRDSKGLAVHYEKMRGELLGKLDAFPKRLSLEEQGDFILGYYHQNQKRFEKRDAESDQIQEA